MSVAQTLDTLLEKIRILAQAETVVGKAVSAPDGTVIVPISKVTVGFGAGGSSKDGKENVGTGAAASIVPVAFLVIRDGRADLVPLDKASLQFSKIIDLVPDLLDRVGLHKRGPKAEKPAAAPAPEAPQADPQA